MKTRLGNLLFFTCLLICIACLVFGWRYRPVNPQDPSFPVFNDLGSPELNEISLIASYVQQNKLGSKRYTPQSIKYLLLAKRLYDLEMPDGNQNPLLADNWLYRYGSLPEVIMPTLTAELPTMLTWDADQIRRTLTPTRIDEALLYTLGSNDIQKINKIMQDSMLVYFIKLMPDSTKKKNQDNCDEKDGTRICYRDHLLDFIGPDPMLVLMQGTDEAQQLYVYCGSKPVEGKYVYYLLSSKGQRVLTENQFASELVGFEFSKGMFDFVDRAQKGSVVWQGADQLNRTSDKNTLLVFTSPSCGACKMFMADVGDNQALREELKNFRLIKVDGTLRRDLRKRFHARGLPNFLVLDPQLKELRRTMGYGTTDEAKKNLLDFLKGVTK